MFVVRDRFVKKADLCLNLHPWVVKYYPLSLARSLFFALPTHIFLSRGPMESLKRATVNSLRRVVYNRVSEPCNVDCVLVFIFYLLLGEAHPGTDRFKEKALVLVTSAFFYFVAYVYMPACLSRISLSLSNPFPARLCVLHMPGKF